MKKMTILVIFLIIVVILIFLPKSKVISTSKDLSYPTSLLDLNILPSDICLHDGMPVIYVSNFMSHGDYAFSYMNKSGDVVSLYYSNFFSSSYNLVQQNVFKGGVCIP